MENEAAAKKKLTKKQKVIITIICILLILLLLFLLFLQKKSRIPALTIVTPAKQSLRDSREFDVDVELSALGDVLYPAASMSIQFDAAHLEFLGVREGEIMVQGDTHPNLPDWSVDVPRSNETGQINILYLDMTGGKYAFSNACLGEDDSLLLRLSFRLRGSAKAGAVYDLTFADAVFAASDETKSLASNQKTLLTYNGKVVVTE